MIELGHSADTALLAITVVGGVGFLLVQAVKAYVKVKERELNIYINCLQLLNRAVIEVSNLADVIERKK